MDDIRDDTNKIAKVLRIKSDDMRIVLSGYLGSL